MVKAYCLHYQSLSATWWWWHQQSIWWRFSQRTVDMKTFTSTSTTINQTMVPQRGGAPITPSSWTWFLAHRSLGTTSERTRGKTSVTLTGPWAELWWRCGRTFLNMGKILECIRILGLEFGLGCERQIAGECWTEAGKIDPFKYETFGHYWNDPSVLRPSVLGCQLNSQFPALTFQQNVTGCDKARQTDSNDPTWLNVIRLHLTMPKTTWCSPIQISPLQPNRPERFDLTHCSPIPLTTKW